jgi:hypothetical protein
MEESRTSAFGAVSGSASRDRVTSESDSVIGGMHNLSIAGESATGSRPGNFQNELSK